MRRRQLLPQPFTPPTSPPFTSPLSHHSASFLSMAAHPTAVLKPWPETGTQAWSECNLVGIYLKEHIYFTFSIDLKVLQGTPWFVHFYSVGFWVESHYLAEKKRGSERAGWVGSLFFFPIQSWPQAGEYSAVAPPLLSPSPSSLSLPASEKHLSINGWKFFLFFFFSSMSHFLCSKPCGCWRPCTPLGSLFFPMNPIIAGSPALVRRHNGINKSKLTSAHLPKTLLLQNALQLFSGLWFLILYVKAKEESKFKTDTHTLGWTKERERKGTVKCLVVSLRGVKRQKEVGILVFTLRRLLSCCDPTLAGSLTWCFLEKPCTSFITWHPPSHNSPASHTKA